MKFMHNNFCVVVVIRQFLGIDSITWSIISSNIITIAVLFNKPETLQEPQHSWAGVSTLD